MTKTCGCGTEIHYDEAKARLGLPAWRDAQGHHGAYFGDQYLWQDQGCAGWNIIATLKRQFHSHGA